MWTNICREMNLAMGCRTYRNKLMPPYPLADDFDLYNLRHTYCTDLEKMGVPINIASRFMGHANINITAKIYTHASTEAIEIGRELIDTWANRWANSPLTIDTKPTEHRLAVMRSGVRAPYAPPSKKP
jgi:integrase